MEVKELEFKTIVQPNRVTLTLENKIVGFATFPRISEGVVVINHTTVYPSYQGKGYASKLMEEVVNVLIENNLKCRTSCSYAASWFSKHSEYQYLLD